MGFFKNSPTKVLDKEAEQREMNREIEYASLKGQLLAQEKHIEFLEDHVERHSNCRKAAETSLQDLYKLLADLIKKSAENEFLKKFIEDIKANKKEV